MFQDEMDNRVTSAAKNLEIRADETKETAAIPDMVNVVAPIHRLANRTNRFAFCEDNQPNTFPVFRLEKVVSVVVLAVNAHTPTLLFVRVMTSTIFRARDGS